MMIWKLPLATLIAYAFRLDEWLLYCAAMSKWYFDIVMLVAEHCDNGCNIPTLVSEVI